MIRKIVIKYLLKEIELLEFTEMSIEAAQDCIEDADFIWQHTRSMRKTLEEVVQYLRFKKGDSMRMMASWDKEKTIIKCKDCNSEISSNHPGQFVICKCPKTDYIYIDQTEFYCRIGGRREKIEFVRK